MVISFGLVQYSPYQPFEIDQSTVLLESNDHKYPLVIPSIKLSPVSDL